MQWIIDGVVGVGSGIAQRIYESPQLVIWGLGVIVALRQFSHLERSTVAENERKKREYALNYSLTRTQAHIDARQELARVFGPTTKDSAIIPLADFQEEIERDEKVLSHIRLLLNHWENMALAIHKQVADEDTAYEMVSQRVINTARQYQNYINDTHDQSPVSYRYFIWLVNRWVDRKPPSRTPRDLRLRQNEETRPFFGFHLSRQR